MPHTEKKLGKGLTRQVRALNRAKLLLLLAYIQILLGARQGRKTKSKSGHKKKHGRGNPAGLIKAIHANPRMTPSAKRKAIAKLRKRMR